MRRNSSKYVAKADNSSGEDTIFTNWEQSVAKTNFFYKCKNSLVFNFFFYKCKSSLVFFCKLTYPENNNFAL